MTDELTLLIQLAIFPGVIFVLLSGLYLMYFERKIIAHMHGRIGPLYVGYHGLLQTIADLMKLLFKEWIFPTTSRKAAFIITPLAMFAIAFMPLAVIPWDPNWIVAQFDVSMLFAFAAVASLPFMALIIGWSSGSKYALIGGYRAASQQIAYEVPLFLSALTPVLFSKSLDLVGITEGQKVYWYLILNPIAAFIFFISLLAMLERQPFDLPEAESELVFGWKTDLSGIFFGWSIFAGYTMMAGGSALFVTIFMGGFQGPSILPGIVWFMLKLFFIYFILFWLRASTPRYRMDQLLKMSWTTLIPLSIVSILVSMAVIVYGGF